MREYECVRAHVSEREGAGSREEMGGGGRGGGDKRASQQLVAELGEGDAGWGVQAGTHGVLGQHGPHARVSPRVPQKVHEPHAPVPVLRPSHRCNHPRSVAAGFTQAARGNRGWPPSFAAGSRRSAEARSAEAPAAASSLASSIVPCGLRLTDEQRLSCI